MDHGVHINTPEQKRQNTRIYATIIYCMTYMTSQTFCYLDFTVKFVIIHTDHPQFCSSGNNPMSRYHQPS